MIGGEIGEDEQVVRYVRPRLVHDNKRVDAQAFVLRDADLCTGLSVNWLGAFNGSTHTQLQAVRQRVRLNVSPNGRFAEIKVQDIKDEAAIKNVDVSLVLRPLPQTEEFDADPSHASVVGLPDPNIDLNLATEIGGALADAVATLHPPPD